MSTIPTDVEGGDNDAMESLSSGTGATGVQLWTTVGQYRATVRSDGSVTVVDWHSTTADAATVTAHE